VTCSEIRGPLRTVVRLLVLLAGFMLLAAFVASGVRVVRVDVLISQGLVSYFAMKNASGEK
jgi:hypothetical protein